AIASRWRSTRLRLRAPPVSRHGLSSCASELAGLNSAGALVVYGRSGRRQHMRAGLVATAAILGTLGSGVMAADRDRPSSSLERPFPSNGRIRMDLAAGQYRILGDSGNRIRMEWSVRDAESLPKVK